MARADATWWTAIIREASKACAWRLDGDRRRATVPIRIPIDRLGGGERVAPAAVPWTIGAEKGTTAHRYL
jgi:hypothetical protein